MRFFSNKIGQNINKIPTHHPCSCSRAFLLKWRTPLFLLFTQCPLYLHPDLPFTLTCHQDIIPPSKFRWRWAERTLKFLPCFEPKIKFSLNSVKSVNIFHRFLTFSLGYGSSIFNPSDTPLTPKIIVHGCNIWPQITRKMAFICVNMQKSLIQRSVQF